MSNLTIHIQHHTGNYTLQNAAKISKTHADHKGRNKTVYICKQQNNLCRKSQGIYEKL
jgi:hypothetical protein